MLRCLLHKVRSFEQRFACNHLFMMKHSEVIKMRKKIIGILTAAAVMFSALAVSAADKTPKVILDQREITFPDQTPIIQNDRTLIPARGVFEAMGAEVSWDQEAQEVKIVTSDTLTRIFLHIGSDIMQVHKITGLSLGGVSVEKTDVTLEAPAIIVSDRTMIPLRAVAEAMDAEVNWDEQAYIADISSLEYIEWQEETTQEQKDAMPSVSLSLDTQSAAAGETFDLYLNAVGFDQVTTGDIAGITASVLYDPQKFELIASETIDADGNTIEDFSNLHNANFSDDSFKFVGLSVASPVKISAPTQKIVKFTLKSIDGSAGTFALSDRFSMRFGGDTGIVTMDPETYELTEYENAQQIKIDTAPVSINTAE